MKKITAALVLATSVLASGGAVAAVNFVNYSGTALSNTITVASATITLGSPVINAWYDVVPPTRQSSAAIAAGVNVATGKSLAMSMSTSLLPAEIHTPMTRQGVLFSTTRSCTLALELCCSSSKIRLPAFPSLRRVQRPTSVTSLASPMVGAKFQCQAETGCLVSPCSASLA